MKLQKIVMTISEIFGSSIPNCCSFYEMCRIITFDMISVRCEVLNTQLKLSNFSQSNNFSLKLLLKVRSFRSTFSITGVRFIGRDNN